MKYLDDMEKEPVGDIETALEEKRRKARERKAAERARMTPEERAIKRRKHDENYRNAHRDQRRAYDREYQARKKSDQ